VYGEGSGFECRQHVQRLNLLRRDVDEQAVADCDEADSVQHNSHLVASVASDETQNDVMSFSCMDVSIKPSRAFFIIYYFDIP